MERNQRPSPDAGAADLATAVLTASRVLVSVSARSLSGVEESLTLTQFRTLVVLHSRDGSALHALAEELGVSASTAMRMVDRLLDNGLLTRDENPADRRQVVISLTAHGRAIVEEVTARRREEIAAIVDRMPDTHQAWLVAALRSFADAAGEPEALVERW